MQLEHRWEGQPPILGEKGSRSAFLQRVKECFQSGSKVSPFS